MSDKITIGFCGDTMLGRSVNYKIDQVGDCLYPWGNMISLMRESDLNVINLETTLTTSERKVPKVFNFKASPDKVQSLKEANIDVVNIANNHILDYSEEGLLETVQVLDKAGIYHTGAGRNSEEAQKAVIVDVDGISIAVLGMTDNEAGWKAGKRPGTYYCDFKDFKVVKDKIVELKSRADILVLSVHWGPNMNERPYDHFRRFAHQAIDHGADIIHGHSAHIFQGVEHYQNGLILYDTGDFVDDYVVDPTLRNDRSFYYRCIVSNEGVRELKLVPVIISDMQVNKADAETGKWSIDRIRKLSAELGTEISESGLLKM